MTWVRLDEMFTIHRKVAGLSDAAFRLHVSALCWSARNLMDGFLPEADLDDVSARVRTPARFAAECVDRGAWHLARTPCDGEKCPPPQDRDGWRIHDYFVYQFTKEQVMKERAAAAKRQANWRSKRNGGSNAVTNGVSSHSPPRTEGKRGGKSTAPAAGRAAANGAARGSAPNQPRPVAEVLAEQRRYQQFEAAMHAEPWDAFTKPEEPK